MQTLVLVTVGARTYEHADVSNVRLAKREIRWTNARGEKRSMALAFVSSWGVRNA